MVFLLGYLTLLGILSSRCFHATQKLNEFPKADGRIHVFAVPRSLVKPFNSDTVSVITNFASLRRSEQNLLLGKTEEETKGDIGPSYGEGGSQDSLTPSR